MPIYEYACLSCGHTLEALQKVSDLPLRDCPQCRQPSLAKQVSAVGFRLKGSGWYETDFKKSTEKKRNLADRAEKSESSGSSEKKTEAA
ncbi:MAG: zinc ribbon domain-containing protein [Methylohalobius sp.]|nr:zinc ribbon domain-containing protein [Methylohalobius sp.]